MMPLDRADSRLSTKLILYVSEHFPRDLFAVTGLEILESHTCMSIKAAWSNARFDKRSP